MLTVADLPRASWRPAWPVRPGPAHRPVRQPHPQRRPQLRDGIALLYADYPVDEPDGFADFHLSLQRAGGLRRWFRPQVRSTTTA
jgi:hypothetical protein